MLTCIALAVITHSPSPLIVTVGEGIQRGVVVAGVCMAIAVTHLTWVGIICFSILPRLVVEEGLAPITGITLSIMGTLTN